MNSFNQKLRRGLGILSALLLTAGCSNSEFEATSSSAMKQLSSASYGVISISITDSSGEEIYSDFNSSTSLKLKAQTAYNLIISAPGAPSNTSFQMVSTKINTVSQTSTTHAMHAGSNSLTVPVPGDYAWKITAQAPGLLPITLTYMADVTCLNPSFTADSLNPQAITVSQSAPYNLYNYNLAGVTSGANGMAPYTCALDATGVGILSHTFTSCSSGFSNVYVNYIGLRNVGVVVKDACNITHSISNPTHLPYTMPTRGGNTTFISGYTTNAAGSAVNDPRVDKVTYLATNAGTFDRAVSARLGGGTFGIEGAINYGQNQSVLFGLSLGLRNISDNIDLLSGTGTVNMSNARISRVDYTTDQAGDHALSVALSSTNCTLSNQGSQVSFVPEMVCSYTGQTLSRATVKIWGHYVCTVISNSTGSTRIEGDFNFVDVKSGGCPTAPAPPIVPTLPINPPPPIVPIEPTNPPPPTPAPPTPIDL